MSRAAYRVLWIGFGIGLMVLPEAARVVGLPYVGGVMVVALLGVAAGAVEGRRRAQTGRSHRAEAVLIPLAVVALTVAGYRVWWRSTRTPAPDDGMAFAILLGILLAMATVFAVAAMLTMAFWARRNRSSGGV
ncbi:MAG: hypothetical protein LCH53_12030 [Bacteroidetes bacterium]|nr:hypothetical protein [Bacteroidota bacterium]